MTVGTIRLLDQAAEALDMLAQTVSGVPPRGPAPPHGHEQAQGIAVVLARRTAEPTVESLARLVEVGTGNDGHVSNGIDLAVRVRDHGQHVVAKCDVADREPRSDIFGLYVALVVELEGAVRAGEDAVPAWRRVDVWYRPKPVVWEARHLSRERNVMGAASEARVADSSGGYEVDVVAVLIAIAALRVGNAGCQRREVGEPVPDADHGAQGTGVNGDRLEFEHGLDRPQPSLVRVANGH